MWILTKTTLVGEVGHSPISKFWFIYCKIDIWLLQTYQGVSFFYQLVVFNLSQNMSFHPATSESQPASSTTGERTASLVEDHEHLWKTFYIKLGLLGHRINLRWMLRLSPFRFPWVFPFSLCSFIISSTTKQAGWLEEGGSRVGRISISSILEFELSK